MKLIFTKVIPATNTKPTRIRASTSERNAQGEKDTLIVKTTDHDYAASLLMQRIGWDSSGKAEISQVGETEKHGGYVYAVKMKSGPTITQKDGSQWTNKDHSACIKMAHKLGYDYEVRGENLLNGAWTSGSGMHGFFCHAFNPEHNPGKPTKGGCIISTVEFGPLFVQDFEDITGYHLKDAGKVV